MQCLTRLGTLYLGTQALTEEEQAHNELQAAARTLTMQCINILSADPTGSDVQSTLLKALRHELVACVAAVDKALQSNSCQLLSAFIAVQYRLREGAFLFGDALVASGILAEARVLKGKGKHSPQLACGSLEERARCIWIAWIFIVRTTSLCLIQEEYGLTSAGWQSQLPLNNCNTPQTPSARSGRLQLEAQNVPLPNLTLQQIAGMDHLVDIGDSAGSTPRSQQQPVSPGSRRGSPSVRILSPPRRKADSHTDPHDEFGSTSPLGVDFLPPVRPVAEGTLRRNHHLGTHLRPRDIDEDKQMRQLRIRSVDTDTAVKRASLRTQRLSSQRRWHRTRSAERARSVERIHGRFHSTFDLTLQHEPTSHTVKGDHSRQRGRKSLWKQVLGS